MPAEPIREFKEHEGHWVHSSNLKLFVPAISGELKVCFFEEPNQNAVVIHQVNDYQLLTLLAVFENWAKVKFKENDQTVVGWLMRPDQCGAPWTNCLRAGKSCP